MVVGQVGAAMTISTFEFYREPENGDSKGQRSDPACKDILSYINESRSSGLFLSSGLLTHGHERIKSVMWETLDKKLYRAGYMQLMSSWTGEGLELGLREFESQDWALQRTALYPNSYHLINTPRPEQWLYRLVSLKRDGWDTSSRTAERPVKNSISTLSWFPSDATSWVGDDKGNRSAEDRYMGFQTGPRQWLIRDGAHYAIYQFVVAKAKNAAEPAELHLQVTQLSMFDRLQPTYPWVCSFRADYRN
ncbi:hypothetical protein GCM10009107_12760 [Ideonella azotifigens]|uniref:Uncharacterized protein n=2 Tax=Ideonella azotifigens TaxID=513160 RepID=A0ABN1JSL5_9BURK